MGISRDERWSWKVRSEREIWLWLNWVGEGLLWGASDRMYLRPGLFALTGGDGGGEWICGRGKGRHHLQIVRIQSDWLRERLGEENRALHCGLGEWKRNGGEVSFCGLMGVWEKDLGISLQQVAAGRGAGRLWAEASILRWAAQRLCWDGSDSESDSIIAGDQRPVEEALAYLRRTMDERLDLKMMGRHVGVSPHHLSRMVRAKTGMTLQLHLRRMRVEHACELLGTGRVNVTEAAFASGYQSLSHFAKAFREETGKTPSEWMKRY
jgi:AraC-like DNA-binding protein